MHHPIDNSSGSIEPLSSPESTIDNRGISILPASTTLDAPLSEAHIEDIKSLHRASRADNSKRSYATAWQQFLTWCDQHGRSPLPASPETIQAWLADMSKTFKLATIKSRLAAVANAHRIAGHGFDRKVMVGLTLDGIRRQNGAAKDRARAIVLTDLRAAVEQLPPILAGLRDRALLLIGFFGALRRSEIVGLDVTETVTDGATGYVQVVSEGLLVKLVRSKTDQHGEGQEIGLPRRRDNLCPVRALQDWLAAAGIVNGAIFRTVSQVGVVGSRLTPQSVRLIVQRHLGSDDTAHGLRAGFITEGARRGATAQALQQTSRHRSVNQLGEYIRHANVFQGTAHRLMED
jgi:integrase